MQCTWDEATAASLELRHCFCSPTKSIISLDNWGKTIKHPYVYLCKACSHIFPSCVHSHRYVSPGPQVPGRQGRYPNHCSSPSMTPQPNKCFIRQLKIDGDDDVKWACTWRHISPHAQAPQCWRAFLLLPVELGIICAALLPLDPPLGAAPYTPESAPYPVAAARQAAIAPPASFPSVPQCAVFLCEETVPRCLRNQGSVSLCSNLHPNNPQDGRHRRNNVTSAP